MSHVPQWVRIIEMALMGGIVISQLILFWLYIELVLAVLEELTKRKDKP